MDWLNSTLILNQNLAAINTERLAKKADVIALLFNANGVDKDGVVEAFFTIYETAKLIQLPIEVIYVPLDKDKDGMLDSFRKQANWFTIAFGEPAIANLRYLYGVTCLPTLVVIKPDGRVVSRQGITDLEEHKKNALISWVSTGFQRDGTKVQDDEMYGPDWRFGRAGPRPKYVRKF